MLKWLQGDKLILGYDLGNEFSQISYASAANDTVETLSLVAGAENYKIPTVLCKRQGVNQWFYGKEALRYAEEQNGILVDNLLQAAVDGEPLLIDETEYDPVALLALFMKRSLGMVSQIGSLDKVEAMMITCEQLNHRLLEVLTEAVAATRLKIGNICFQNYTESYYHYMIKQPQELWAHDTVLCEYVGNQVKVYRMECNKRTTPVVAFIENREYGMIPYHPMPEEEALRTSKMEKLDREMLQVAQQVCENRIVSSIFLIGDHFDEEWMKDSLRYLCRGRRVFQGNNLYSKGACYGMLERLDSSEVGKSHVFLGNDKLKANIGMKIYRRGEESYIALLDAGLNWFEANQQMEFYLQGSNIVELIISPLIGKNSKKVRIGLEELQGGLTRLAMKLFLEKEDLLVVEIEDLGLGELRPATHRVWREEIPIY